jgi:hypothetical protein
MRSTARPVVSVILLSVLIVSVTPQFWLDEPRKDECPIQTARISPTDGSGLIRNCMLFISSQSRTSVTCDATSGKLLITLGSIIPESITKLLLDENCGQGFVGDGTALFNVNTKRDSSRQLQVTRASDGSSIADGGSYIPGELLVVSWSGAGTGEHVFEVVGAAFASDDSSQLGCTGSRTKSLMASLRTPEYGAGEITIRGSWTDQDSSVYYVSEDFKVVTTCMARDNAMDVFNSATATDSSRQLQVTRASDGSSIADGGSYIPGESLVVSWSGAGTGEHVFEVVGAAFASDGKQGCLGSRANAMMASLQTPKFATGVLTIRGRWKSSVAQRTLYYSSEELTIYAACPTSNLLPDPPRTDSCTVGGLTMKSGTGYPVICDLISGQLYVYVGAQPIPPLDCVGGWGDWGDCNETCGGGAKKRIYNVTVTAERGGAECAIMDDATSSTACNEQPCPVNCVGGYGDWSSCSTNCGPGVPLPQCIPVTLQHV